MAETLREALRERLEFRAALQWVGFLAVLWYVFDPALAQFATTLVSLAVFGLTELATDVYDVRQSVRNGGLGIYALASGTAMALFDGGALWFPLAFVLVGAWFVADAVQTVRHEGATETEPTGRDVYHDYVARRVQEVVEERPYTRRELYEALESDDGAVDAAIERLESRGVVVREGSSIRTAESEPESTTARVRERIGGFARRVARPLTLELDADEANADETRREFAATKRRGDRRADPDGAGSADVGAEEHEPEREREREREPTD